MRAVVLSLALASAGCSFTRYGELTEDAPVVVLERPGDLALFGQSVVSASFGERTFVVSGGAPGAFRAAAFNLGMGDDPGTDPVDTGYCSESGTNLCRLGVTLAGLNSASTPFGSRGLCFAVGVGSTEQTRDTPGVLVRCDPANDPGGAALNYVLPVPFVVQEELLKPALVPGQNVEVALHSDAAEAAALVAGAPAKSSAWFYPPLGNSPVELVAPAAPVQSFGARVASLRLPGSARIFAVSAPALGQLWLFRSDDGATAVSLGCLSGAPNFGRVLTSGAVDADGNDELIVSGPAEVSVLDGALLAQLPPNLASSCDLSLSALATLRCGETGDVTNCGGSEFGAALAVGDLDGDGDGEVLVGAPGMNVRDDADGGGAVLVYDVEAGQPEQLSDVRFIASAEGGDRLGSAVSAPRIAGRAIVAAGAPGGGKTALFYCSPLVPEGLRGARCR